MNRFIYRCSLLGLCLPLALFSTSTFACATCGCSLATDAAMGYSAASGWAVGFQFDYINQNQLRSGSSSISSSEVAAINDAGGDQEVEHNTINRYLTGSVSYAPNADWNFRLLVPYVDRSHTTYSSGINPLTPDQLSGVGVSSLGDMKFITSFQGLLPTHNFGVQVGIKLPTGHYGGPNADGTGTVGNKPVAFSSGPNSQSASPDNLLDTSLQAGTGSTDLILGAYYYQAVSQDLDAFVNGQFQTAVAEKLNSSGEDYRPGNLATVSVGLRYEADPRIVPQLQVNFTDKGQDQGALADVPDSAGTAAYISPGISLNILHNTSIYSFVQIPVYSHLDGYQLFPKWTATAGLGYAF